MKALITGFPRSGTHYMVKMLNTLGLRMGHEFVDEDGCVSWKHLPQADKFDVVFHQVRDPVEVIGSALTISEDSLQLLQSLTPIKKGESKIHFLMKSWLDWTARADKIAKLTYKVESFTDPNIYFYILSELGIKVPEKLPDIPSNIGTRKGKEGYSQLSVSDLEREDKKLAGKIREMRFFYGYSY